MTTILRSPYSVPSLFARGLDLDGAPAKSASHRRRGVRALSEVGRQEAILAGSSTFLLTLAVFIWMWPRLMPLM